MLLSQSITDMDKVTIQYGSLRKSYDIFSLPSQMYEFMEKEGFCLPRRKTITDVPNEILTSIFQHLDRKSLISVLSVCQRFFDHGAPLLWYTVCCCGCVGTSQDEEDRFDLPELLAEVLSKPATSRSYELFIRELNIMVAGSLSAQLLCCIQHIFDSIPNMSNLTHLKLSFAREEHSQAFSERMASNISCTFIELMKLPRLQVLNVEPHNMDIVCQVLETEYNFSLENSTIDKMCFGLCTMPVSEGHFQQFIQSFKALESLELWDVGALSISLWAEILSSETITRLDLNYAEFETVDNFSHFFFKIRIAFTLRDIQRK